MPMCRGFGYPSMPALEALQLSSDGRLAAALSSDGVLSLLAADKLAAACGINKL